jgi:CRP/FNR family nitrogen fixation transcriptional regulator
MGSITMERAMQTGVDAVQHTPSIPAEPKPHRAAPDALDLFEQLGSTVKVRRSGKIYREGDPTEFCWRIVAGCARTVKLIDDGRRHVGEFLWPGDLLGIDAGDMHYFDSEAVTDATLRRYSRGAVEALARDHAALTARLRMIAAAKVRAAREQMVLLGRKTATEKIASFLMEMDRRSTATRLRLVELPMSRVDIADHLSLTDETVCRILAHLQHDGIVAVLRSGIGVRDRVALRNLAHQSRR